MPGRSPGTKKAGEYSPALLIDPLTNRAAFGFQR